MKARPIIFGDESVRAILAGTKMQTRRLFWSRDGAKRMLPTSVTPIATGVEWWAEPFGWEKCPYGVPGDRLWVRETWGFTAKVPVTAHEQALRDQFAPAHWLALRADQPAGHWCWRSPIHMPRWASRLTLEITDVRVQRLQEISEQDAKAEGVPAVCEMCGQTEEQDDETEGHWCCETDYGAAVLFEYRIGFLRCWDSINGKRAPWSSDPWVWAITFRRFATAEEPGA